MPRITAKDLDAAMKGGAFAPVYYFHGDEDFRKDAALRRLADAAVDRATRDFNLEVRRGAELDARGLESLLATPPMMAERRLVAVRDVGALKKDARATLDRYVQRPAPDTVLVLVAPAGAKPDRTLCDAAAALDFEPLNGDRLAKWVVQYARNELGATVTAEGADLLVAAVGNDLQQIAAELDKLASYARGHSGADAEPVIDEGAVSAVVGVRRGETVGDLLDAVARRDAGKALGLVEHVLSQPKTSAVTVVMALSTQFLALAWGQAMRASGVTVGTLRSFNHPQSFGALLKDGGAFPGRPWGEAVAAWAAAVDDWSEHSLDRALALLLDADLSLKETKVSSDEQLLSTLVLALCALPGR